MPTLIANQLSTLRTYPHASNLFLIVQQPMVNIAGTWSGYFWSCQINGDPAGTEGDLVAALTVNNGDPAKTLLDGMTVFIGTDKGDHEKGVFVVRGDQVVNAGTVTLNIGSTSEVVGIVEDDDWIVVLDEFRLWTRYPRITEAGGVLSWYKDYDVTYASLGASAATRRAGSLPPVPIMGPHRVAFVDPDDTVSVDFDWSDSYAMYGAAPTAWSSVGVRGATSGNWTSALENPPAQTYNGSSTDPDNDVSGLAGFRVSLEVNPLAGGYTGFNRFRRGIRYVFTLRRPGQRQAADPTNAEPITDFEVMNCSGSYDNGSWRASVTIFDSQAHEYEIWDGALVILFAEDWYGDTKTSVGPITGCENIIFVGRVADGSIQHDPETGNVSFDVISAAGQAQNREMYPVPIENNDGADEWYECPDLTVDRAAWFYLVWHSTLSMICDWYQSEDTNEIYAMDFLAGDIYSTLDTFYQDRIFGRVLCDRYERIKAEVDLQLSPEGTGTMVMTLTAPDWLEEIQLRESTETPTSIVELGGINYNTGLIQPFLGKAPGTVNRLKGRSFQSTSMAIGDQPTLNTLAGRILAKQNARWGDLVVQMGNWRVFDIWPQEYLTTNLTLERITLTAQNFIPREISIEHEGGALFVTTRSEMETGGISGQTIEIPEELPVPNPPQQPQYPPSVPPTPDTPAPDEGRRMLSADIGVFATNNIGASSPVWYPTNTGFVSALDTYVYDIKRDPWHWWTSGGTERTLWAGTRSGIWKMENYPYGTWTQVLTKATIAAACGLAAPGVNDYLYYVRMGFSIEVDGLFAFVFGPSWTAFPAGYQYWVVVVLNGVIQNTFQLVFGNDGMGWGDVCFAPHSAGNTIYCVSNYAPAHAIGSLARLWKTVNRGGAWNSIDSLDIDYKGARGSIAIPYVDASNPDSYILWGRGGFIAGSGGRYRISYDKGISFGTIPGSELEYSEIDTGGHPDYIWFLSSDADNFPCKWSNNQGSSYTSLPLTVLQRAYASFVMWANGVLQSALIAGEVTPDVQYVMQWKPGSGWADKTGNLGLYGIGEITQIDRDSMGTA